MKLHRATIPLSFAIAAATFFAVPGLRWIIVREMQNRLGVTFDSDSTTLALSNGVLQVQGARVSRMSPEGESSLTIDSATLQILHQPLLSRRIDVNGAVFEGVQYPDLEEPASSLSPSIDQRASQPHDLNWFPPSLLGGSGDQIYRELGEGSNLDQQSKEVENRWMATFDAIELDRIVLDKRVQALQSLPIDSSNPLRNVELIQKAVEESNLIQAELTRLQSRIDSAHQAYMQDKRGLDEVKLTDTRMLTQKLSSGPMDSSYIAQSILIELSRQILRRIEQQASLGTSPMDALTLSQPSNTAKRGQEFLFQGTGVPPLLQVRKAQWSGQAQIGSRQYEIQGKLKGLASDQQANWPMQLVASIRSGEESIQCTAYRTASISAPADTIEILAKNLGLEQWSLSNQQGMQLVCRGNPIQASYRKMTLESDTRIELEITQLQTDLGLQSANSAAGDRVSKLISGALSSVGGWKISAEIHGDYHVDSNWSFDSDLKAPLESSLREAVRAEIALHETQFRQRYQANAKTQQESLDLKIAMKESESRTRLAALRESLQTANSRSISRLELRTPTRQAQAPDLQSLKR